MFMDNFQKVMDKYLYLLLLLVVHAVQFFGSWTDLQQWTKKVQGRIFPDADVVQILLVKW